MVQTGVSHDRSIESPAFLDFFVEQIAKPEAKGQSFLKGSRPITRKRHPVH